MVFNEKNIIEYLHYCKSVHVKNEQSILNIVVLRESVYFTLRCYDEYSNFYKSKLLQLSIKHFNKYLLDVRNKKINKIKECLK